MSPNFKRHQKRRKRYEMLHEHAYDTRPNFRATDSDAELSHDVL